MSMLEGSVGSYWAFVVGTRWVHLHEHFSSRLLRSDRLFVEQITRTNSELSTQTHTSEVHLGVVVKHRGTPNWLALLTKENNGSRTFEPNGPPGELKSCGPIFFVGPYPFWALQGPRHQRAFFMRSGD